MRIWRSIERAGATAPAESSVNSFIDLQGAHRMLRFLLSLSFLTLLVNIGRADTPIPTAPTVEARAFIVVDYRTGKVLAGKDADSGRNRPASPN